jgi:hypothetical protein
LTPTDQYGAVGVGVTVGLFIGGRSFVKATKTIAAITALVMMINATVVAAAIRISLTTIVFGW